MMPSASPTEKPRWIDAPVIPDSVLVNIGDAFDFWTGGRFPSTQHRVSAPRNADESAARFSIVYFLSEKFPPISSFRHGDVTEHFIIFKAPLR